LEDKNLYGKTTRENLIVYVFASVLLNVVVLQKTGLNGCRKMSVRRDTNTHVIGAQAQLKPKLLYNQEN
jgi:hypothetical protein